MLVLLVKRSTECIVQMSSGSMIYVPGFMMIGKGVERNIEF
jgi:hypothetical protein